MITANKVKRRKKVSNSISAIKQPNYSNEYANWLGTMDWEYMITIRKNYRTVRIKNGIPFAPVFLFSFLIYSSKEFWVSILLGLI